MSSFSLRASCADDAPFSLALTEATGRPLLEALGKTWSATKMQRKCAVDAADLNTRIVQVDGRDVGVFGMHTAGDGVWLDLLFLDETAQHQGIGRALVERVKSEARSLGMPVRLHVMRNSPAVGFYEHLGFVVYGELDPLTVNMQWPD